MIDGKLWSAYTFQGGPAPTHQEALDALKETFVCPRCGRPDLPLALAPHHEKSCAYECGIGMPPLDKIEQQGQRIWDLEERVRDLESMLGDAVGVIQWFGGWLNNRKVPLSYDDARCACGHMGSQHTGLGRCTDPDDSECECDCYRPDSFSVSYDARSVARAVHSYQKLLHVEDFRCEKCRGRFSMEHHRDGRCEWCPPKSEV